MKCHVLFPHPKSALLLLSNSKKLFFIDNQELVPDSQSSEIQQMTYFEYPNNKAHLRKHTNKKKMEILM